jgi:hypothetical protein
LETIQFKTASRIIKNLRINLTKETNENYKPLKRELKKISEDGRPSMLMD